jgi:hypothetical protein
MSTAYEYVRRHHVALLALFVALGGTSYAVTALDPGSVGTIQIKNGAVTSNKVLDGSLRKTDFAEGVVVAGAQGPQGASGATNLVVRTRRYSPALAPNRSGSLGPLCAEGERAISGGAAGDDGMDLLETYPIFTSGVPTGWSSAFRNGADTSIGVTAFVVCVSP